MGVGWLQFYFLARVAPEWSLALLNDVDTSTFVPDAPAWSAFLVIETVVLAPFVEELVTRGVLLHRWGYKWGAWHGALFSSLFFAVLHLDPLGAFAFGMVMAMLYLSTGSLLVPILCHAMYNGIIVAGEAGELVWGDPSSLYTIADFRAEWWKALLALAITTPLLWLWIRRHWPRPAWRIPTAA